jgi:anti-sigma factor RsiW
MELAPNPICDRVRGQISLDLDGELSQLERAMLASHVRRCPSCAAFQASATSFTHALRTAPLEALERPMEIPSPKRWALAEVRFDVVRVAAAAAGIAVVLSLALGGGAGILGSERLQSKTSEPSAYLQSMDYERLLIEQQANRSRGSRIAFAV